MGEDLWQNSTSTRAMLSALGKNPSKRKRRLFGCACCRRIWPLAADERSRAAVVAAEQFADGGITGAALELAERTAKFAARRPDGPVSQQQAAAACACVADPRPGVAMGAGEYAVWAVQWSRAESIGTGLNDPDLKPVLSAAGQEEGAHQADLLRDIIGNPFRPGSFDPTWRTSAALLIAQGIYQERAWDRMCILADALQDAGAEGDILDHLRGPGPHARGCAVLDAVLGRE